MSEERLALKMVPKTKASQWDDRSVMKLVSMMGEQLARQSEQQSVQTKAKHLAFYLARLFSDCLRY
jgi:hypothetical protein